MNVALPWLLLVGPQPITAMRGVNPFSMLQLRCATFRWPADHACTRPPCSTGTRPASIATTPDERISAHATATEETHEADNPALAIPHDAAGFRRHVEHQLRCR